MQPCRSHWNGCFMFMVASNFPPVSQLCETGKLPNASSETLVDVTFFHVCRILLWTSLQSSSTPSVMPITCSLAAVFHTSFKPSETGKLPNEIQIKWQPSMCRILLWTSLQSSSTKVSSPKPAPYSSSSFPPVSKFCEAGKLPKVSSEILLKV